MTSTKRLAAASLALAASVLAGAASAAEIPSRAAFVDPEGVSVHDVTRVLTRLGFADVQDLRKDGQIFTLTASWEGTAHPLRVNTRNGTIRVIAPASQQNAGIPTFVPIPDAGSASIPEVRQQLANVGFTDIGQIREDGNIFETNAMFDGAKVALRVDSRTGGVSMQRSGDDRTSDMPTHVRIPDRESATPFLVRRELTRAGFTDVGTISKDGDVLETRATWQGKQLDLRVLAGSGQIIAG